MTDEPKAVELAAGALLRELDRLAASALSLHQDDPPDTADVRRDMHTQRERSQELVEAVTAARERASSLVDAARSLVDTATIERIERHEWPTRRTGVTLPMPSAASANGTRTGRSEPDPAGEHVALTRALAFMTEHARDPITIQDVAAVSRVGVRHLQGLFRRQYGVVPMGHLRQLRLDGAHADLRRADPTRGVTVEQIARRWQFLHLGRFASAYRDRFGLVPSRTLRTGPVEG